MPFMPLGARIFLGNAINPLVVTTLIETPQDEMFKNGARFHSDVWSYARQSQRLTWQQTLQTHVELNFRNIAIPAGSFIETSRPAWTPGRYTVTDMGCIVLTGS